MPNLSMKYETNINLLSHKIANNHLIQDQHLIV